MANLTLENIGRIVESGQTEKLFSGNLESGSSVSDRRIETIGRQAGLPDESMAAAQGGKTFTEILEKSVGQVNEMQHQADHAVKELISGRNKNIHETLLTVERADASLKMMMQVRNKILDAYREIMRMQV